MNKGEKREALVNSLAQFCGAPKTPEPQKRSSCVTPNQLQREETDPHRKTSCPESVFKHDDEVQQHDIKASPSSTDIDRIQRDAPSPRSSNAFLSVPFWHKFSSAIDFKMAHRSSSARSSRANDLDPDGVNQSVTRTPPTAPRVRKRGVTFRADGCPSLPPSLEVSPASTPDLPRPIVQAIVTPPSGACRKLPNGRCRRFSDVMEHRRQVRVRRVSCENVTHPGTSSSNTAPLTYSTSPHDVKPSPDDVTWDHSDESSTSPIRHQSAGGRRSPNSRGKSGDQRTIKSPTTAAKNTGRVKQLLRKLDSAPVPILSSQSRRVALQRSRHCNLSYVGDYDSAGGGSSSGEGSIRARSRSLSAVESSTARRSGGGIVCTNQDIIRFQDSPRGLPSGREELCDRDAPLRGKRKVECAVSTPDGSVVSWQGDSMVVNVGALGRAMEEYLCGGINSD